MCLCYTSGSDFANFCKNNLMTFLAYLMQSMGRLIPRYRLQCVDLCALAGLHLVVKLRSSTGVPDITGSGDLG